MSAFPTIEAALADLIEQPGKGNAAEAIRTLDAELAARREDLPDDLRHYLERRSYQKALAYLRSGGTLAHRR
ncbi:MAG: hypothetical protein ACFB21_00770 [Opitutales bacterium]